MNLLVRFCDQMVGIYLARTLISDIEKVKFSYWSTVCRGRSLNLQRVEPPPGVTGPSFSDQTCLPLLCHRLWFAFTLCEDLSVSCVNAVEIFVDFEAVWEHGIVLFVCTLVVVVFVGARTCAPDVFLLSTKLPSLFLQFKIEHKLHLQAFSIRQVWLLTWLAVYHSVPRPRHHHHHHHIKLRSSLFLFEVYETWFDPLIQSISQFDLFHWFKSWKEELDGNSESTWANKSLWYHRGVTQQG